MKARRNGIIEIARFVFGFFILFYHNLFAVEVPYFNNANFVVDFFFLLIGFFLLSMFTRYDEKSSWKSTFKFVLSRLRIIGIPLLIAYGCNLVSCLIREPVQIKVHYLWFIHIMIIAYFLFFILYRLLRKNKKWFLISLGVVFLVTFLMRLHPKFYYYDELRGLSMISFGVFMSQIPKLNFKDELKIKRLAITGIITVSILILGCIYLSSLSLTHKKVVEFISDLILFPAFIYFSLHINFKSKITDVLGLSSDFIYIYQPVCVLLIDLNIENHLITFAVLLLLVVITTVTLRLIGYKVYKSKEVAIIK